MKFSLIHPSRSRPEKSLQTIQKWIDRCSNLKQMQLLVSIDVDDPKFGDYIVGYDNPIVGKNNGAIEAINKAARFAIGQFLIVVSDDTDCPMHWDKILREAIGQSTDFVMKTDDGIQKRIITMPIMDRVYYERDGYIYNPTFRHSWADTYLTEVAHKRGRVITRMDIKFPHLHYSIIGEKPDELYRRNDKTHDEDRHIFKRLMERNHG